jgi:hypothetical protein
MGLGRRHQRVFAEELLDDGGCVAVYGCDISAREVLQEIDHGDAHNLRVEGDIVQQNIRLNLVAEGWLWIAEGGIQHIASRVIIKLP